jgi:hypothetical protein
MTVYQLIEQLTASCGPQASFGDVELWWSERQQRLFLGRHAPSLDYERINKRALKRQPDPPVSASPEEP